MWRAVLYTTADGVGLSTGLFRRLGGGSRRRGWRTGQTSRTGRTIASGSGEMANSWRSLGEKR